MKFSDKYKPLFAKPKAREVVNSPDFSKMPKKAREWWEQVDSITVFVITGGRGSGKSLAVEVDADTRAYKYNHKNYYTRYTNDSLKDTVIADFEKVFEMFPYPRDVQNNRIEYGGGGEIVFKGLKRGSKSQTAGGKGLSSFNCQIVEEAEEHPSFKEFDKMKLSLRRNDLPNYSILLLNPTTKTHWIYEEFFQNRGVSEGSNCIVDGICFIHTTYLDVPKQYHTKENWDEYEKGRKFYEQYLEMKNYERETCDPLIKRYWHWYKFTVLGGWLEKAEGVVFKDWTTGKFDDSLPYCYGMDFGYSPDPTAICKVAIDKDKKLLYIQEYLYAKELSTEDIFLAVKSIVQENDLIIADNAEVRLRNELRQKNINIQPCVKGADSIRKGIKDMLNFQVVVCGESINLKMELNNYAWNDKRAGIPIDQYNHIIDGVRYAVERLTRSFFVG